MSTQENVEDANNSGDSRGSSGAFDEPSALLSKQISSKNWRERASAFEKLKEFIEKKVSNE